MITIMVIIMIINNIISNMIILIIIMFFYSNIRIMIVMIIIITEQCVIFCATLTMMCYHIRAILLCYLIRYFDSKQKLSHKGTSHVKGEKEKLSNCQTYRNFILKLVEKEFRFFFSLEPCLF